MKLMNCKKYYFIIFLCLVICLQQQWCAGRNNDLEQEEAYETTA